jgi:hypothetical protein
MNTDEHELALNVISVEAHQGDDGQWAASLELDFVRPHDGYHHVYTYTLSRGQLAALCDEATTASLILLTGRRPALFDGAPDDASLREWPE